MRATALAALTVTALAFMTGCASIISKSNWPVTVKSNPPGANCQVAKAAGAELHRGETPMTVTLPSSEGYFKAAKYKITCQKEGYQPTESYMKATVNGWPYVGGNLIFGGLIGWVIVDPATGAMYKLKDTHTIDLLQLQKPQVQNPQP